MCIVLSTTSNPDYALILISNRDEVFERSSERLELRELDVLNGSHSKKTMLMGLDNINKGTWLSIDNESKGFAIVLNVQSIDKADVNAYSRGFLPLEVLKDVKNSKSLVSSFEGFKKMYEKVTETRYFKLIYGQYDLTSLSLTYGLISLADDKKAVYKDLKSEPITVTSNQYESGTEDSKLLPKWEKIEIGKALIQTLSFKMDEESLIDQCFRISEHNTFQNANSNEAIEFRDSKLKVRSSVFIPKHKIKIQDKEFAYGTRTTTLILVRSDGSVKVVERERVDPSSIDRVFEL